MFGPKHTLYILKFLQNNAIKEEILSEEIKRGEKLKLKKTNAFYEIPSSMLRFVICFLSLIHYHTFSFSHKA